MKRSLSLVALFACLGLLAHAQDKAKPAATSYPLYADFTYGWASPQGNFASKTPPAAGYAVHGSQVTTRLGWAAAKNFSLEFDYFYARYGVQPGAQINGLYLDNWKYSGITFGPAVKAPMGTRFEANFKLKGGVAWIKAAIPDVSGGTVSKEKSSAFMVKPGFDLRYSITPRVYIRGDLDWAFMSPKFKFSSGNDLDQQVSALHIGFGLGVRF